MSETLFSGGDGTKASPYLISTVADLNMIPYYPTLNYKQINDIDFVNGTLKTIDIFSGSYDGCNFKITNADVNYAWIDELSSGAKVERMVIENWNCTFVIWSIEKESIVRQLEMMNLNIYRTCFGNVSGVVKECSIKNSSGLISVLYSAGRVEDCYGRMITSDYVDCFISVANGGIIANCYVDSLNVTGRGKNLINEASNMLGGIVGHCNSETTTIKNCFVVNSNIKLSDERDYKYYLFITDSGGGILGGLHEDATVSIEDCYVLNTRLEHAYNRYEPENYSSIGDIVGNDRYLFNKHGILNISNCYSEVTKIINVNAQNAKVFEPEFSFEMNDKWNISASIQNKNPYLRRFWEGTELPIQENPWVVNPNVNDGMPYLKKEIDGNVFVKTANSWIKAKDIYIKTSTGWRKANNTVKAKTSTGWK